MKVYLVADQSAYQWLVEGIFSSEKLAEKFVEELLEPYEFDATDYYSIHEIEMDKRIEGCIGMIL